MNKTGKSEIIIPIISLLVVGLLFLFIINFGFVDRKRPECLFPVEIDCVGYQTSNNAQNSLQVQLLNNMHENLTITHVELIDSKCSYGVITDVNGTKKWPKDTVLWLNFHCKEINTEEDGYVQVNIEFTPDYEPRPMKFEGRIRYFET